MYKSRKEGLWARTLSIRDKILGNYIGEIGMSDTANKPKARSLDLF